MIMYMKWKNFKLIIGTFFILNSISIKAQYSNEFLKYSKQFPEASIVRLQQETIINITQSKEGLKINKQIFEEDLYLNETATYNSKNTLKFSSFFELENIEASSFLFTDGKYIAKSVEQFTKKDELNGSFYDDIKLLNFIYPNLKKGSKTKLKYSELIKDPRFLPPFYFGEFYPVINNKVTLIVDKGVDLDFREFNVSKENIQFLKEEKRRRIIYTWQVKNQKKYDYESNTPSFKTVFPHIVPIIKSYEVNKQKETILGEVSDLYRWYYSLVKDVNKEKPDKDLIALVNTITANKTTDLEKVKAIYYWVQKNIKYIAFEYALGGFIPRESNDVFRKKYGDCKDNSSILYRMLEIAGVKGSLTWIGTRDIPYSYEDAPTPIVDNHMILSYKANNGKIYYLDATGRYIKFGMPTSFIQGKEALVSYGKDFKVKKVPIVDAKVNAIIDTTTIKLVEKNILGNTKTTISGYLKTNLFHDLEDEKTNSKLIEFYNNRFRKGNNKFLINFFTEKNKYDYDKDFIINHNFKIEDYTKKLGEEIYINLNLNKDLSHFKTEKKRKYAIEYDFKRHLSYNIQLEIPLNYNVNYLPENIKISNNFLTAEINYSIKENTLFYNHIVTLDYLLLSLEEQKEVNKLIEILEKNYKEIVVLKKK